MSLILPSCRADSKSSALTPTASVTASAFAYDRGNSYGGQRLAEVLVYTNALSETVKRGIRSHLLGKWKNVVRTFGRFAPRRAAC
jgi:hypothetical protein